MEAGRATIADLDTPLMAAKRAPLKNQEELTLSIGMLLFTLGFVLYGTGTYVTQDTAGNEMDNAWLFLLYGVLQTSGLIVMTQADLDTNRYLRKNKGRMVFFVLLWVLSWGTVAITPPMKDSAEYWLANLPWLYFILRFKQIADMQSGFPVFTELFVLGLTILLICTGVDDFLTAHWREGQDEESLRSSAWIWRIVASYYCLATIMMLLISYKYAPWKGQSATVQLTMSAYAYLFFLGLGQLLTQILQLKVMHDTADEHSSDNLSFAAWCFGPVHIVPACTMFCFRRKVHRYLGIVWLKRRLAANKNAYFSAAEEKRGTLAEVEEAIAARTLNKYCLAADGSNDQYTMVRVHLVYYYVRVHLVY
jgi:hypothetical protein